MCQEDRGANSTDRPYTSQPSSKQKPTKPSHTMVREREPSAPQPARRSEMPAPAPAPAPAAKPVHDLKASAPQFGETSPLRNPLKQARASEEYAHLFNKPKPGQRRPEHFQAAPRVPSQPSDTLNRPFKVPSAQPAPRYSTASSTGSDIMEIPPSHFQPRPSQAAPVLAPRPFNAPPKTSFPPPRPMYTTGRVDGLQVMNAGAHNP